jgi:C4-dicarboxylate-binding protein DctP
LKVKFLAQTLVTAMVAIAMQSACADGPLVIRFSHVVAPASPKGQAAERFAHLVAARTAGKVRVDIYPNSQLYGDQDEIAALQLGNVEMLAPSLTKLKVLHVPEFEVFDLPFLFQDLDAAHRVTQGPIGQSMLAKLDTQGVVGLAIWDNGFKQISANRPIHTPADVVGLTLRIQPSKILEAQVRVMGAKPRVIPFNEVYGALRTGAVDGTEGPVSNFYTQNLHQTQKYLTLSNHGYLGYGVIVNKKFWDALAPDVRVSLEGSLKEATTFANDTAQRNNEAALSGIEQSGKTKVIRLSTEEKLAWQRTLRKVHQQPDGRIPTELIVRIYQETGYQQTAVAMH